MILTLHHLSQAPQWSYSTVFLKRIRNQIDQFWAQINQWNQQGKYDWIKYNIQIEGHLMQLSKQNYLDVTYHSKKGLILQWSFHDLLKETVYFHHLFVLMTEPTHQLSSLLQIYFTRLKEGDLMAFVYFDGKGRCKLSKWTEKNHVDSSPVPKLLKAMAATCGNPNQYKQLLEVAAQETSNTHCNIITNFLLQHGEQSYVDSLKNEVKSYRKQGALSGVCSIMGPKVHSQISFSTGIHTLRTDDPKNMVNMYHKVVSNAVFKKAKLIIECLDGEIGPVTQGRQDATHFSQIQRQYYGVSAEYKQEVLQIIVLDPSQSSHFDFVISLQLEFFSCKTIKASKNVRISFERDKNLSVPVERLRRQVYELDGVTLQSNPFESYALIKLIKAIQG